MHSGNGKAKSKQRKLRNMTKDMLFEGSVGFSKCEWEKKRENMKSKGTTLALDLTNDLIDW